MSQGFQNQYYSKLLQFCMICGILVLSNFQKKNVSSVSLEVNPFVILDKKLQSKGTYVWKY